MEYWENLFKHRGTLWNFHPSNSALTIAERFKQQGINNILIPGVGYGRNAAPFLDLGIKVTGIEISESAIKLARKKGFTFPIFHGSVLEMPFDDSQYKGIFCYSLLHLFNRNERKKLIASSYNQLNSKGLMIFVVVSTKAEMFGKGRYLGHNRFQNENGLPVYFYNKESIEKEFKSFGLQKYFEFEEPIKFMENQTPLKCFMIICKR